MEPSASSSTPDPLVGREIAGGRYVVTAVLGRGGMGTVYVALQRPVDRKVALKVIHRELASNAEVMSRFLEEMRVTAAIEHPHTVRVYDFGDLDGQPFLTTELLDGRTLRDELAKVGRMPQARAAAIVAQICKGLRAAHAQGVVHRDLKPENIMLLDVYGERDYVKVLDFGIARSLRRTTGFRTGTGALLGTPAYMSPEQCEGREVDARSDLYTLGLIAYELVVGDLPFPPSDSVPQMLLAQVAQAPPDVRSRALGLDERFAALVMALLAKDPAARPADTGLVLAALEELPFVTGRPPSEARGARASSETVALATGATVHAAAQASSSRPGPGARPSATVALPEPDRAPRPPAPDVPAPKKISAGRTIGALAASLGLTGVVAVWLLRGGPAAPPAAEIAQALSRPEEPPFPTSCVSADAEARRRVKAALGSGVWSDVPAGATERLLTAAREPGAAPAAVRERLEAVVAACPDHAGARSLLGTALVRLDENAAAEAHLRAAATLAPGFVVPRYNLAVALVKQDKAAEALPLLDGVLAAEPAHATARLVRGQARLAAGDPAGAASDLREQTEKHPRAALGWLLLGEALTRTNAPDDARRAFCEAKARGAEAARAGCPD